MLAPTSRLLRATVRPASVYGVGREDSNLSLRGELPAVRAMSHRAPGTHFLTLRFLSSALSLAEPGLMPAFLSAAASDFGVHLRGAGFLAAIQRPCGDGACTRS